MRKRKSKIAKLKGLFSKKRLAIIAIVTMVALLVVNFRDVIFFSDPAIVGNYRARYNEMSTESYLEQLRTYARETLNDSFDGLDYKQLVTWEHNHLFYWGGELQVRPEMPIDILSTNYLGTVLMKNGGHHYATFCTKTNTFIVYLSEGETTVDIVPNSWESWNITLGRCGEFALLYNGLLLANHYDSRIVVDCSVASGTKVAGDHVWNEVWINETWTHVDPTEAVFDSPDMYSDPDKWNKEVNKVYAIHGNEILDVTKTYAGN